jgi:hypothetical protein
MDEPKLRQFMQRIGVQLGRPTSKGWASANCPLAPWTHRSGKDRRASFAVLVDPQGTSLYTCLGCKNRGTVSALLNKLADLRGDDSLRGLAMEAAEGERAGLHKAPDFDSLQPVAIQPPDPIDEDQWFGLFDPVESCPEAARYMVHRRVSRATCHKLGIVYDPDTKRIVFPVRGAGGELYGFTGRAIRDKAEPKVKDFAGLPKRHLILGRERWREGYPVAVVEGLFAYARLHEEGVEEFANIGALLGSEITPEKAALLVEFGHAALLLTDPDVAGDLCLYGPQDDSWVSGYAFDRGGIAKLEGHIPVLVPDYPEGIDDPDDLTAVHVQAMLRDTPMFDSYPWKRKYTRDQ